MIPPIHNPSVFARDAEFGSLGPVIKWAGGKRQLLPVLVPLMPAQFDVYHEPFLGGGAVFFELFRIGRLRGGTVLSEYNEKLVQLYETIRDDCDGLIQEVEKLARCTSKEDYLTARKRYNESKRLSPVRMSALFLYLNRLCFNGLYRVNGQGKFNVPYGQYTNPNVVRETNLRAAAAALASTDIFHMSFERSMQRIGQGDFAYLDPPYAPLSRTSSFTAYAGVFGWEQQIQLANLCQELDTRGAQFMLSNSSAPEVLELYKDFSIEYVRARRSINSKGGGRGAVKEIVVTNYR